MYDKDSLADMVTSEDTARERERETETDREAHCLAKVATMAKVAQVAKVAKLRQGWEGPCTTRTPWRSNTSKVVHQSQP